MQPNSKQPDIGQRIAASRLHRGLSQGVVSRRAGIDPSYLSRIETGKVHPTVRTAMRIAAALRTSIEDLVGPSPPDRKRQPCPVSASGRCILDLIDSRSDSARTADLEAFSPQQIRLLRHFRELLHCSSAKLLGALEVLLGEMLESGKETPAGDARPPSSSTTS